MIRRRIRLALFFSLMVAIFITQVAATGQVTALAIASAVGFIAPFVLKYVNLDGRLMLILTFVISVIIAVVAEAVSGELRWDAASLYQDVLLVFGVTQLVYAYFKDHPLGPLAVK